MMLSTSVEKSYTEHRLPNIRAGIGTNTKTTVQLLLVFCKCVKKMNISFCIFSVKMN